MHRIREVINVLNDFKNKREINRTRKDYLDLLKQDLCNYYSYNDFLMEKLIDLFPLAEVGEIYLSKSKKLRFMNRSSIFWKQMKSNDQLQFVPIH
jgi:ribosomal RNA methyltransferase Nop2